MTFSRISVVVEPKPTMKTSIPSLDGTFIHYSLCKIFSVPDKFIKLRRNVTSYPNNFIKKKRIRAKFGKPIKIDIKLHEAYKCIPGTW